MAERYITNEGYETENHPNGERNHSAVTLEFVYRSLHTLYPRATVSELQLLAAHILGSDSDSDSDSHEEGGEFVRDETTSNYARDSGLFEEIISQNLILRTRGEEDVQGICVICQCEYEEEETVGGLRCGHEYHANCINTWLMENNSCPVCRRERIPSSEGFDLSDEFSRVL